MARNKQTFFWGCQIPARLPFLEKSIRLVVTALGLDVIDLDGFTCCPEKALVKNRDDRLWHLTAARNLALAEKAGTDIITPCNGCFSTLKGVATELNRYPELKEEVNSSLARVGLEFRGAVQVKHLVEVLHDEVGTAKVKSLIQKPLSGIKVAVHNGCHMVRPSNEVHFDDPLKPVKYDALVEALGATSIPYPSKMLCCGGALGNVGEAENSFALVRKKLVEAQELGADVITMVCPSCFMQYDQKQYMAQRQGEALGLPVVTLPELIGLTMGFPREDLGLDGHRMDLEPFFTRWERASQVLEKTGHYVDLASARRCYQCGACVNDCPVAEISPSFEPNKIIGDFVNGKISELIHSPEIWKCLECHTCRELCSQGFGMEEVFTALKHLAMEEGVSPAPIKGGLKTFIQTGRLGLPDNRARNRLGLGEAPATGHEELQRLLAGEGLLPQ